MFDAVLQRAVSDLAQSSGHDLVGFELDAEAAITHHATLVDGEVERTDNVACRLRLTASVSPAVGTMEQVRQVIWDVWSELAYDDFQATVLNLGPKEAVLRFITAAPPVSLCVTGELRVGGEHFARLARKGR